MDLDEITITYYEDKKKKILKEINLDGLNEKGLESIINVKGMIQSMNFEVLEPMILFMILDFIHFPVGIILFNIIV
jgi:hypothetical protein